MKKDEWLGTLTSSGNYMVTLKVGTHEGTTLRSQGLVTGTALVPQWDKVQEQVP